MKVMKDNDKDEELDFDQWVRLAQENPERFEELRRQRIEAMIAQAPEDIRKRIEGLQWRIDQLRQTSKNPMAACIRISTMMWDFVLGRDGLVQSIENLGKTPEDRDGALRTDARILDFGRPRDPDPP